MSFTSINFIFAIIVMTIMYYCLSPKIQWVILLIASVLFYMTYGIEKLPFILAASLITYFSARKIDKIYIGQDEFIREKGLSGKEKKEYVLCIKKQTKQILLGTIGILVLMLVYAKAGGWIQEAIAGLEFGQAREIIPLIVALGVSYYTFSLIAYIVDVYRRQEQAEQNYFRFLLFAIYFPKILQGPISRHKNLAPQFAREHEFCYKNCCFGVQLALWGFFKKLVMADRMAILVNQVFASWNQYSGSVLLLATILGVLQLYCDFSGCMDIARGVSQIFGIELEKNFERPFFSRSAAEFWRRWHITLGSWFKDYVCMPIALSKFVQRLSRSARQKWGAEAGRNVTVIIPLAAVWIVTGLWHGTGIDYIIWGVYWGSVIIISMILEPVYGKLLEIFRINVDSFIWRLFQMVRTFLLFCFGRLLVLPGNIRSSGVIIKKIFTEFEVWNILNENIYNYGLDIVEFNLVFVAIVILLVVSILQEKGSVREMIAAQNIMVRWGIYYAALFAVVIYGVYGPGFDASVFVYMNF